MNTTINTTLPLNDIQGLILRGYRMDVAEYIVLQVRDAAAARQFLAQITPPPQAKPATNPTTPNITTAAPWANKPQYCLNCGITAEGLRALGVNDDIISSFPTAFQNGARARAHCIGDVTVSAPEEWIQGFQADAPAHLILVVFAQSASVLDSVRAELETLYKAGYRALAHLSATALPNDYVHFGYRDSIAQPTIQGAPERNIKDDQPVVEPGAFILGQQADMPYPIPKTIGQNGSYGVFRMLEQNVAGFETFLANAAAAHAADGLTTELLAAKVCGRWRNGVPLVLSPDTDSPNPPIPSENLNNFDYMPEDEQGVLCPAGAHIRRSNPRSSPIKGSLRHRIIRRAMPYGAAYNPAAPHDGIERGLIGFFIGGDIEDQFEFIMRNWVNNGEGVRAFDSRDPMIGSNQIPYQYSVQDCVPDTATNTAAQPASTQDSGQDSAGYGLLTIPRAAPQKALTIQGFTNFVRTRASAYCFLPSISALRTIAGAA